MSQERQKSILVMAPAELAKHIKIIAKATPQAIKVGAHTKWERMPERSITYAEIVRVLQAGSMTRVPENGKWPGELKCRLKGKDEDGKKIEVEVCISESNPNLFVITVIRIEK